MQGTWVRKPRTSAAVVFVHGILSSGETCWRHSNGTYWPKILSNESTLSDVGIYVFTYKTSIFSGTYRLGDAVDALYEFCKLDKITDLNSIIFVCHSMGGIVVRKLIVDRDLFFHEKKTNLGLFLIASPSLGSDYATMLEPLARLFGNTQADVLRFSQNNSWLFDLDKEFLNLKESRRLRMVGRELVEDVFIVLRHIIRRQVVKSFQGAKYWGDPFKVPDSDHFSIAKPANSEAIQHRILLDFCLRVMSNHASHLIMADDVQNGTARMGAEPFEQDRFESITPISSTPNPVKTKMPDFIELHEYYLLQTDLVGRLDHLATLDTWEKSPDSYLLVIEAFGGFGKSALASTWWHSKKMVTGWAGGFWFSFAEGGNLIEFFWELHAYLNNCSLEESKNLQIDVLMKNTFDVLRAKRVLVILDSFERLLRRADRLSVNHERLGALVDAESSTELAPGQASLRSCQDRLFAGWLQKLAGGMSKLLLTTRYFPSDLETSGGSPRRGVSLLPLTGLTVKEAQAYWTLLGLDPEDPGLERLVAGTAGHPLTLSLMAARLSRALELPSRSLAAFFQRYPSFPVFMAPLSDVDGRGDVFADVFSDLVEDELQALYTIAAYGTPAPLSELQLILSERSVTEPAETAEICPEHGEKDLIGILISLEDRKIIGRNRSNEWDMHPY